MLLVPSLYILAFIAFPATTRKNKSVTWSEKGPEIFTFSPPPSPESSGEGTDSDQAAVYNAMKRKDINLMPSAEGNGDDSNTDDSDTSSLITGASSIGEASYVVWPSYGIEGPFHAVPVTLEDDDDSSISDTGSMIIRSSSSDSDSFTDREIILKAVIPITDNINGNQVGSAIVHGVSDANPSYSLRRVDNIDSLDQFDDDGLGTQTLGKLVRVESHRGDEIQIPFSEQTPVTEEIPSNGSKSEATASEPGDAYAIECKEYNVTLHWNYAEEKQRTGKKDKNVYAPATIQVLVNEKQGKTKYCLSGHSTYTDPAIAQLEYVGKGIARLRKNYTSYIEREYRLEHRCRNPVVWAELPNQEGYVLVKHFDKSTMINKKGERFEIFGLPEEQQKDRKRNAELKFMKFCHARP